MNLKIVAASALWIGALATTGTTHAAERQLTPHPANKYKITAEEQSACGTDAARFCSAAYPDEDKIVGCMKVNRPHLSVACRPVFDEGMRRRHLN